MPLEMITVDVGDKLIIHLQFAGGRLGFTDAAVNNAEAIATNFNADPVGQRGFRSTGTWHLEGVIGELLANDLSFGYGGPIGGSISTNLTDSAFSITGLITQST